MSGAISRGPAKPQHPAQVGWGAPFRPTTPNPGPPKGPWPLHRPAQHLPGGTPGRPRGCGGSHTHTFEDEQTRAAGGQR